MTHNFSILFICYSFVLDSELHPDSKNIRSWKNRSRYQNRKNIPRSLAPPEYESREQYVERKKRELQHLASELRFLGVNVDELLSTIKPEPINSPNPN